MHRLRSYIFDDEHNLIFDIEDVVALLAHKREEAFEGERAVRLFQFRTWITFPGQHEVNAPKWAGFIAAVKLLDRYEEDYFADEEMTRNYREDNPMGVDLTRLPPQTFRRIDMLRKDNRAYREIYDKLIGRCGGLLGSP